MNGTDSLLFPQKILAPDFSHEQALIDKGYKRIAGVDEAGRGPLAGPVVAAAVILDPDNIPEGLNDSKKLNEKKREGLFEQICMTSLVGWSAVPAEEIDRINILQATFVAMERSVSALPLAPDRALIDGRDVPLPLAEIGSSMIKGDARSLSIAAASIIAKVIRDRMMVEADKSYFEYGFAGHKGYGSKGHMAAIEQHGPCKLHRMSFAPMKFLNTK